MAASDIGIDNVLGLINQLDDTLKMLNDDSQKDVDDHEGKLVSFEADERGIDSAIDLNKDVEVIVEVEDSYRSPFAEMVRQFGNLWDSLVRMNLDGERFVIVRN